MKLVSQIVFGFSLLLFSFQQVNSFYQFVHYKLNQEEITLEFCINKDKPEMQCDGKCHLAKKLEQGPTYSVEVNTKNKQLPFPQEKLRLQEEILFLSDLDIFIPKLFYKKVQPLYFYQNLLSEAHLNSLERPPGAII